MESVIAVAPARNHRAHFVISKKIAIICGGRVHRNRGIVIEHEYPAAKCLRFCLNKRKYGVYIFLGKLRRYFKRYSFRLPELLVHPFGKHTV